MTKTPTKAGRPGRTPEPGERVQLGLRVTPEIKERLDRAAALSGRSQSQEAEMRIDRTFRDDDLLPQLMAAAYGERLAGLLMIMGSAMSSAGRFAGFDAAGLSGSTDWINQPWAFEQSRVAAMRILEMVRPEGEPEVPARVAALRNNPNVPDDYRDAIGQEGMTHANGRLSAVIGRDENHEMQRWAELVQKNLGQDLVKRIKQRMGRK